VDDDVELAIPARAEFVALVRLVVSSVAADHGLTDDRIDDLKIAVSEACTNAIEAHRQSGRDDLVTVRCTDAGDRFVVHVEDRGRGFDVSALPAHPPVTDPDRLKFERGLGIPLIRELVDEAEFESTAAGTAVRLAMRHEVLAPDGRPR
jgi:serine/threonine-protein kinase RsbW